LFKLINSRCSFENIIISFYLETNKMLIKEIDFYIVKLFENCTWLFESIIMVTACL